MSIKRSGETDEYHAIMRCGDHSVSRTVGRDTQVAEVVNAGYLAKFNFVQLLMKIRDVILISAESPLNT